MADESGGEPPEHKGAGKGHEGKSGIPGKVVDDGVAGAGADEGRDGNEDEAEGGAVGGSPESGGANAMGLELDVAIFGSPGAEGDCECGADEQYDGIHGAFLCGASGGAAL